MSLFAFLTSLRFTYSKCKASSLSQHGTIGWQDMIIAVFQSPLLQISFKCLIQQQTHVLFFAVDSVYTKFHRQLSKLLLKANIEK